MQEPEQYRLAALLLLVPCGQVVTNDDGCCSPRGSRRRVPAFGEEQERQVVIAHTCFPASAGVGPAMSMTIEIRPQRASDA
jgi:hypothetical protein